MSGFLMAVSWWRHGLQCIVIIGKLDLSREGLTRCHGVLVHGLNLRCIPLRMK